MPVMLQIPDSAVTCLDLPPGRLEEELRKDLAGALYGRGALPVGKAIELAGVSRREFEALLRERGIRRPFDARELDRELACGRMAVFFGSTSARGGGQ